MQALSLSAKSFSSTNSHHLHTLKFKASTHFHQSRFCCSKPRIQLKQNQLFQPFTSTFLGFNPLRVPVDCKVDFKSKRGLGSGAVCYAAPISLRNLQLISTVSTAILMIARGTSIHKSFLVPLFALQTSSSVVSWIKGEYGIWTAFLALLVHLFFFIPGELELPFMALLLIIVSPYQVLNLRDTQEGVILSLVIAAYLAFQHFSRAGSLQKAFDQGSILASLAIICIVAVPCFLLI